jgi:hypothetical protein
MNLDAADVLHRVANFQDGLTGEPEFQYAALVVALLIWFGLRFRLAHVITSVP